MQRYTINDSNRDYPDDDTCLERLKNCRYPDGSACEKCQRETKYHRDAERRSYSCQWCGHHVHPTAGTIFHKSTTPLKLWFYAIFKMASTRCGISAKQLERELGVTYKRRGACSTRSARCSLTTTTSSHQGSSKPTKPTSVGVVAAPSAGVQARTRTRRRSSAW